MAAITEVPFVALLPNILVQNYVLRPFRYQTGGTILVNSFSACIFFMPIVFQYYSVVCAYL